MAAIGQIAAGDKDDPLIWDGGIVPGPGDTVAQTAALDILTDWTVGSSPATGGTPALEQTVNNMTLTLAAGRLLRLRGELRLQSGAASVTDRLVLNAGAGIEFDASLAASPSTTKYRLRPNKNSASRGRIRLLGTDVARCFIRSNAGGANAWIDREGFTDVLEQFDATYTDFTRIGDATNPFWDFLLTSIAKVFRATHCVFDGCGQLISGTSVMTGSTLDISHSSWKNSAHATRCVQLPDFLNTGTKLAVNTVFDKDIFIGDGAYDFTGAYFHESYSIAGGRTTPAITVGQLVRKSTQPTTSFAGDPKDSLWLKDGAITNPHWGSCGSWNRDFLIEGNVFAFTGTNNAGDILSANNPASARVHTVRNNVVLPLASGDAPGKFISMGGGANVTFRPQHNTFPSNRSASGREIGISWGETYAGHVGIYDEPHSNLAWCATANRALVMVRYTGTVQDGALPAEVRNNGTWNGYVGTDGTGYESYSAGTAFSTPPGTDDVNVLTDPFADRFRTIESWDASLGGPGTVANALTELQKRNDATGYNPAYTIAALVTYLRDGFKITDPAFENAGFDGVTIGAMPMVASITGAISMPISYGLTATATLTQQRTVTGAISMPIGYGLSAAAQVTRGNNVSAVIALPISYGLSIGASLAKPGVATGWIVPIRRVQGRLAPGNDLVFRLGPIRGQNANPLKYLLYGGASINAWLARPAAINTRLGGIEKVVSLTNAVGLLLFDASDIDAIFNALSPAATAGEEFRVVIEAPGDFLRTRAIPFNPSLT